MRDHRDRTIRPRREGGFTLAEVLIASTVSMIVLVGLYLLYDVNQATLIRGEQQTDLQQNARIGMDRIVREIRLAGSDPQLPPIIPAPCATAIQSATATSISFIADVDSDGTTEKVEYTYDPACTPNCISDPPKIRREQWPSLVGPTCTNWAASGNPQPLAERVTALTIAYYDAAGNLFPTPVLAGSLGNIRRISVIVTTADTVTGRVPQPFTLRAEIRPRNLGLRP